jgi:hypothetical protein
MPEPPYQMAGQPKKTAAERLSSEQHKIILKWYWKFENVCAKYKDSGSVNLQWNHQND